MRNIVIENKNIFLKLLIAKNIPVINTMLRKKAVLSPDK